MGRRGWVKGAGASEGAGFMEERHAPFKLRNHAAATI